MQVEDADKPKFYNALKVMLFSLNGTYEPPLGAMAHYWEALKPYPWDKVLKNMEDMARTSESHVTPGQLAKRVSGKTVAKARDAFDEVISEIRKHGVDGARQRLKNDEKIWKLIQGVGGLAAFNASNLSEIRSAFYAEFDK